MFRPGWKTMAVLAVHDLRIAAHQAGCVRLRRYQWSPSQRDCLDQPWGFALRAAAPALPTRGNSRSPSPSFCSPVIGPLNLISAASRTRFIPKPCAGRWNVPGFGSRAGARNCSVGFRSCMACLSRQREHSGYGQGRTRAPPAAYQFRRLADGRQVLVRR
jgi:hypothetical protein